LSECEGNKQWRGINDRNGSGDVKETNCRRNFVLDKGDGKASLKTTSKDIKYKPLREDHQGSHKMYMTGFKDRMN
jgi:hypothetical protein